MPAIHARPLAQRGAWSFGQRSTDPVPETAEHAVELAEAGALEHTEVVTVGSVVGEQYDRVVGHKLGAEPEPIAVIEDAGLVHVPF